MQQSPSPIETLEQMLGEDEPNLMRLYLSPHVAQTCFCLDRYIRTTWPTPLPASDRAAEPEDCQSFLANGFEEALGGAIKLVRYGRGKTQGSRVGLVLDPNDRLAGFADQELTGGERVEFLPGLRVIGGKHLGLPGEAVPGKDSRWLAQVLESGEAIDPLVLVADSGGLLDQHEESILKLVSIHQPAVIVCVDRQSLASIRRKAGGVLSKISPQVVVFDESFVDRAVPFGAFTAGRSHFAAWNRPGKSTFHSTTFQPNTISTRHFMNTLAVADPDFCQHHAEDIRAISEDLSRRGNAFRRYYQPSLYRLIRAAGFETKDIRATGSLVVVDGRPILDFVGGVACSVRGHNPPTYAAEMRSLPESGDLEAELSVRFRELTGLGHILPAVSGGTAVEHALRLSLVAQFPRRHILALKAGFGGKTLLSLTGTANPSYKENVGPLYADVHYVDPFAADALQQIDALLEQHDFAAVQVELIQSVGGVRRLPEELVRHLDAGRARWGYLLIVDEVQTGMYRTGPFSHSSTYRLMPDLLLLGKGTSDMMVPFSLTLYSDAVAERLSNRSPTLVDAIRHRHGYELGYKTVLNVLQRAENLGISGQVADAGERFSRLLHDGLATLKGVREIRVYGLLIAIELDARSWPRRWLGKRLAACYLLAMLHHKRYALLAGFCQYEPNTLKITPPLNVSDDEIVQACKTIVDVLGRPTHEVLIAALGRLFLPSPVRRKGKHERRDDSTPELARI
jgi:acetylornithine/succinyldiaminopimelate/putrescine aminotransferase